MDGALFTKKLRSEDIQQGTIDYSKNVFFYSDEYIRQLKKYNMPIEVIHSIFSTCHQMYIRRRYSDYNKNKDSEQFVENMMTDLDNKEFIEIDVSVRPKQLQKTGLIHVLANDKKLDVRWGDKKI